MRPIPSEIEMKEAGRIIAVAHPNVGIHIHIAIGIGSSVYYRMLLFKIFAKHSRPGCIFIFASRSFSQQWAKLEVVYKCRCNVCSKYATGRYPVIHIDRYSYMIQESRCFKDGIHAGGCIQSIGHKGIVIAYTVKIETMIPKIALGITVLPPGMNRILPKAEELA